MSERTVLEFGFGNPVNLTKKEIEQFISSQQDISIKQCNIIDDKIHIVLDFETKQAYLSSFHNSFRKFSENISLKREEAKQKAAAERAEAEAAREVLEFNIGNPKKLNTSQVWHFIENQEVITISDAKVSNSGILFYAQEPEAQSLVKEFHNAFITFSENQKNYRHIKNEMENTTNIVDYTNVEEQLEQVQEMESTLKKSLETMNPVIEEKVGLFSRLKNSIFS